MFIEKMIRSTKLDFKNQNDKTYYFLFNCYNQFDASCLYATRINPNPG